MIDQLIANIKKTNAPIVVGLDPMMKFIPEQIQKAAFAEYGETLKGAAEAIWQYNKGIVDAVADLIPAVKPQIAMYEQFGVAGLIAFQKTVAYCKEKGLVVIGDVKRGDIGSTSEAYAVAHLGKVVVGEKSYAPFDEDFATVNPYLGSDGINPFIKVCKEENKGIFVLVKTSNPGYGAQGGKGADLVHFFNEDGLGAIVNSSRGIIAAYQQEKYAQFGAANYADASRQAVIDMREDIAQALQGRK